MDYEQLETMAEGIPIIYVNDAPKGFKGAYKDGAIFLNFNMPIHEKKEVLAEELGHHFTSVGDITDYKTINNRKQELKARRYGCELIITLDGLIECWQQHMRSVFEMAEYFNVSPQYILKAINHYRMKYGLSTFYDGYLIRFEPLNVYEYKTI